MLRPARTKRGPVPVTRSLSSVRSLRRRFSAASRCVSRRSIGRSQSCRLRQTILASWPISNRWRLLSGHGIRKKIGPISCPGHRGWIGFAVLWQLRFACATYSDRPHATRRRPANSHRRLPGPWYYSPLAVCHGPTPKLQ